MKAKTDMKNGMYVDDDGTKSWFKNDKLHRNDGPAVIYTNDDFTYPVVLCDEVGSFHGLRPLAIQHAD